MRLVRVNNPFSHEEETTYQYNGNKIILCNGGLIGTFGRVPDSIEIRLKSPKKKGWIKCKYTKQQSHCGMQYHSLYVKGEFTLLCGTEHNFIRKYITNYMEHEVFYIKGE